MDYLAEYKKWCEGSEFDEETKAELREISNNQEEIEDRFYKELEFGTAGLRGIIGAGTNRMNKYTVGKATQGLANYIKKQKAEQKGVVISFDSRHMSPEFSIYTALCLNANGIKTYIMDELRPVPVLSYAVRELGCTAGVMITASHNPPKYNGYKVFWEDGSQIVAPVDKEISQEVRGVEKYSDIKTISMEEAKNKELYNVVGKEIEDKYIEELKKLVLNPEIIREMGKELKIVYTPLHGAGNKPVQRILKELGFEKVYVVPEQEKPDGDFPTVEYPNPEDPKAFKLALELAKEKDADVILATDPDSDRLGIYAKDSKTGEYMHYTGNMSALLIAEYQVTEKLRKGILPKNGAIIKTIVSSNLTDAITEKYDLKMFEVLTGFKYIGELMKQFEQTKEFEYLFGFEESYGCLIGTHARDKDGVVAVMALCEAAAFYKKQGFTLWDQMINIYEKYGYYKETQTTITLEGSDGAEKIKSIMEKLRANKPQKIGEYKVLEVRDYKKNEIVNLETGAVRETGLPNSNVLYYDLENNSWCCARPSGTEPKIKFYMGIKGTSMEDAEKKLNDLKKSMLEFID